MLVGEATQHRRDLHTRRRGVLIGGAQVVRPARERRGVVDIGDRQMLGGLTDNDVDLDTLGLAITTATGNGIWEYSTDSTDGTDGSWTAFGPVAGNSALSPRPAHPSPWCPHRWYPGRKARPRASGHR